MGSFRKGIVKMSYEVNQRLYKEVQQKRNEFKKKANRIMLFGVSPVEVTVLLPGCTSRLIRAKAHRRASETREALGLSIWPS